MPQDHFQHYSKLLFHHSITDKNDPEKFERHCHDYYEVLYVVRGTGKYMVEGEEYQLKPQTLLLTRPYEYHYVCPDKGTPYERYVIQFGQDILPDTVATLAMLKVDRNHARGIYFDTDAISSRIRAEFTEMDAIRTTFENDPDRFSKEETMLALSLMRVLLLLSLATPYKNPVREESLVARVIGYLNLHLENDLSLDKLAQRFFVSKYYLCHAFRKQTGISILTYITTKRIAMAEQLLLSGEPATAVAYQVGFSNYSSFYRAFCKQTGVSPTCNLKNKSNKNVIEKNV